MPHAARTAKRSKRSQGGRNAPKSRLIKDFFANLVARIIRWWPRILIGGLVIWGLALAYVADVPQRSMNWMAMKFYAASEHAGFGLKTLNVTGRQYTDPDVLRGLTSVDRGESIFAVDVSQLQDSIERLPWVESAAVRRVYPDALNITLTERVAIALWQRGESLTLIDAEGIEIKTETNLDDFTDLPIITGSDAPEHAPDLMRLIAAQPIIAERFDSAIRVGERRWDIRLDNGMLIKLPSEDTAFALARIAEAHDKYLIFGKEILSLDARISDKIILKTSSGAAQSLNEALKRISSQDNIHKDTKSVSE